MTNTTFIILAHRFFRDFTPFAPYMAIYFSRSGLTVANISFLFLIWSLTSIVLEIPTGFLADRYNRKTILVIAQLGKLLAFSTWLFAPSFLGFMFGLILWGIATSLDSGTFQAFLFELTRNNSDKHSFNKIYGKANAASFAGLFVATLVASFLVQYGFQYLLWMSLVGLAVSLILITLVPSFSTNHLHKAVKENTFSFRKLIKGFPKIIHRRTLLVLFIVGVAATGLKAPLDEYHALLFENRGVPLFVIGFIIAGFELIKSFGAFVSSKVHLTVPQQNYFLFCMGLLFIAVGFTPSYVTVIVLIILILGDMVLWMSNDAALQHEAVDGNRATLMSVKSFTSELLAAGMLGLFGFVSMYYPVGSLYVLSGVLLTVAAIGVLMIQKKVVSGN